MAYKHNNACKACNIIREEVRTHHKGRKNSPLWRAFEDYQYGRRTLVSITQDYPVLTLTNVTRHKDKHQVFTVDDVQNSHISELQRVADNEKLKVIFKAALKADDMRTMVKEMLTEIMNDEDAREKFKNKLKPSDIIKMANDEDTLELKKVDTAHEIMKTMNAFASGETIIEMVDAGSAPEAPDA